MRSNNAPFLIPLQPMSSTLEIENLGKRFWMIFGTPSSSRIFNWKVLASLRFRWKTPEPLVPARGLPLGNFQGTRLAKRRQQDYSRAHPRVHVFPRKRVYRS